MKALIWERLDQATRFFWALTLVTLPVTSFRFMPFMGSDSQVHPLSLIPAAFLFLLLVIKSFQQKKFLLWSNSLVPLLAFALVALFSSGVGFLLAPVNLYQYTYESRVLRAWVTLGVGLLFFMVTIGMNRDESDLQFTLKWLYWGIVGHLVWSCFQLLQFYILGRLFESQPLGNIVDAIQKKVMMAGLASNQRISGLALEPSWLAAQVAAVYLPWVVAALLKGYRLFRRGWLIFAILIACIVLMLFTYSRSGILIAVAAVLLTILLAGWSKIKQAWEWFKKPFSSRMIAHRALAISLRTVSVLILLAGLAGGVFLLSRNQYFAQIWQSDKSNLVAYFVDIYAGPRLAYAWAGWTVFEQHPWTGVGLGGLGLYLHKALPDWSHFNIGEIAQLLSPDNLVYPNSKNLYVRLLSETGILGFWLFVSFYLLMLGKALALLRSSCKALAFVGVASLLAWFVIVALGFSQDSFAMPTIWFSFGLLVGITDLQKQTPLARSNKNPVATS